MGIFNSSKIRPLFTIIILIVIIIIVIGIIRSGKKWAEEIKAEFLHGDGHTIANFLSPDEPFEKKVRNRRKRLRSSVFNDYYEEDDVSYEKPQISRPGNHPRRNSNNKTEERVRNILEDYFDDYFPTSRPNFLRNPKTNRNLELDGYNARLNMAFEYQGIQHRVFPNRFHKTEEEFEKQQSRDSYKRKRLYELGIKLLEVPDTIGTRQSRIENFVHNWLKQNGFHK
jgi:hypothetical protein